MAVVSSEMGSRKRGRKAEEFDRKLEHDRDPKAVKVGLKILDKMDQEKLYVMTAYFAY